MSDLKENLPENFSSLTSKIILESINKYGWNFSCEDIELTPDEVSAKDGMQPIILWKAKEALSTIWGNQEIVFRCEEDALCGVTVEPKRAVLPTAFWLHAVHYVLEEEFKKNNNLTFKMDQWYKDWDQALKNKKVLLLPSLPLPTQSTKMS